MFNNLIYDNIINSALEEDIGQGDITTNLIIPENTHVKGSFVSKEAGIICGIDIIKSVFKKMDNNIVLTR